MNKNLKRLLLLTIGSVGVAFAGGGVIAQQAQPEAAPPTTQSPSKSDPNAVSEPEPSPNPVKEQQDQNRNIPDSEGGIDPELGPIAEPDAGDISPALRMKGEGDWQRPQDNVRDRVRREALDRAEKLNRDMNDATLGSAGMGSDGPVMPRLMAPNIPLVPMELLFPPEVINAGPPPVRESRGSVITIGTLNREGRTNTRLRIPTGQEGTYGSLRIKVHGCFMSHPEDSFESWAYVEVVDRGRSDVKQLAVLPQRDRNRVKSATGERVLRKGWIIASSPSVTPIDHPTYDMWLINCEGNGGAGPQPQWPGGIAPPGQANVPPEGQPSDESGRAVPGRDAPTATSQGKSTGN